ncbi:MocR-like pyridoxine biosynthesis transcription factor PdxR [Pseudogracilibacillus auburnensis]|uniref:MocR-like pyridoxine biosynthesis transcription factor PdxR n=1 Tax=Pseudogracilibacillus auburnensis TaxID=1494959 RepID=UPI001A9722FC|nr:PLP-dependent aminotransferase family protein [Pseudogracilibacillus auburnensis]MBO1003900.1 PLP-dependent aminotransferase family protein [Pseudogracilibacillus auburnensis]
MDMLSCHLNRSNDVPLYEQLYGFIKQEITEGHLEYGSKLPSKRKLSEFLKISQNTVETAYDQLTAEGYIEGIPRKGYFVLAYEDLEYVQTTTKSANEETTEKKELKYYFHPSRIDTENFPFTKWRKYARDTIDQAHHSLLLLGDKQGELELRQQIVHYLYHARGVKCTAEQIIIGAGSDILMQQLILLLHRNTIYGVENPGYHVILHILKSYQNKVHPLEVDDEGVKVSSIEQANIDTVYVTPSQHFPYGSVLSVNRRIKLLNWAAGRNDRYIIEDDYDSEFRYSGKSIPSLQSMDHSEKVVYLGSFSKSLIPSLRISYMVLPKHLLKKYREKELSYYHCSVSRIDQHILSQFMKEGDFERHLNRMRKIYRRKLEKTLNVLKPYKEKVDVIGEHSGLHIVLTVKNGMEEQELIQRALKAEIKIHPLSSYSLEKKFDSSPKMILGFAGIPEDELESAIKLLLESWGL